MAKALVGGEWVDGDVEVRDGRIAAVGVGAPRRVEAGGAGLRRPAGERLRRGRLLRPGEDGYARAGARLLADGVTAFQPTLVTAPSAEMVAALGRIAALGGGSAGGVGGGGRSRDAAAEAVRPGSGRG